MRGPDDLQVHLVFFSTFEELELHARAESAHQLSYKQAVRSLWSTWLQPTVENMMGRVPLFPLFLDGNATSTIPHHLQNQKLNDFQHGMT